jgi:outer membrane protein
VRVAQAYFDVLGAQDTLLLVRAQREAISEQLAQAKRNFEVGTATITDTHERRARYDLNGATEDRGAERPREQAARAAAAHRQGRRASSSRLRADIQLTPPNPNDMQTWVESPRSRATRCRSPRQPTKSRRSRRSATPRRTCPTLDFFAQHGQTGQNATVDSLAGRDVDADRDRPAARDAAVPGGALTSRDRESAALANKAKEDLENARRNAALSARQNYLAVINGIAQVTRSSRR